MSFEFIYTEDKKSGVSSLLVYTTTTTAVVKEEVNSFNFKASDGKWVSINDILGTPNGIALANKVISSRIKNEPERYHPVFSGLKSDTAFRLHEGVLTVLFNAYELAPGSEGIVSFDLIVDNVVWIKLTQEEYRIKEQSYNLRMIPLRKVCEALGYLVVVETPNNSNINVTVSREGKPSIYLTWNANSYTIINHALSERRQIRSLEAPPELINVSFSSHTFVPISFFDQILELIVFNVSENGVIEFATYLDVVEDDE
jgi:hypothetical protein